MLDDFDIEQFAEDKPVEHALLDDDSGDDNDNKSGGGLFRFVAIFLGVGLAVLALGAVGYFVLMNSRASTNQEQSASLTQVSMDATAAYDDALLAQAATETAFQFAAQTDPTATLELVNTPVNVVVEATQDPRTATVEALLTQASVAQTQAANAQLTITPTATALPNTGFLDDYGPTGMLFAAMMLVVVIFFSRKIRTSEN